MRNNGLSNRICRAQWCGVVMTFAPMVTDDVTVYGLSLHLHPHGFRFASGHEVPKREHRNHLQFSKLSGNPTIHQNIAPEMLMHQTPGRQGLATLGLWALKDPRGAQWIRPHITSQKLTPQQQISSSPVVSALICPDRRAESNL